MKNLILSLCKLKEVNFKQFFCSSLILVFLLLSFSSCSNSNKKNDVDVPKAKILVLATDHFIPDSSKHEAEQILEKLIEYKPDLVATEYSPYYDTLSLSKWETNYYKTIKSIREEESISTKEILDSINHYHELSDKNYSLERLAKLARLYYLLGDKSNYHYYIYRLVSRESDMSPGEFDKVKSIVSEAVYDPVSKRLRNNEYGNIVFPLAVSQNIKETTPVDHQAKADSFVYWQKHHYKVIIEKYTKPVYDSILDAYRANRQAENSYNNMLSKNTHKFIQDHPDFYWPIPGLEFDSFSVKKTLKPWDYRNELSIERLDSAIQSTGSQRAIITYGSMHAPPFIEILKRYPQYEVLILEDL